MNQYKKFHFILSTLVYSPRQTLQLWNPIVPKLSKLDFSSQRS